MNCSYKGISLLCLLLLYSAFSAVFAQSIALNERDAEVWLPDQVVRGSVEDAEFTEGVLYVNDDSTSFDITDSRFAAEVRLQEGPNEIVACAGGVCSGSVTWDLGYQPAPEPFIWATVDGGSIALHSEMVESPNGEVISYAWSADASNPIHVNMSVSGDTAASVSISEGAPAGEYYFNLDVVDEEGVTGRARTFVTVDSVGIHPFDIQSDHAAWVDEAVIYEITPYIFQENGDLSGITGRLPEIKNLGVNTLWIQPIFETAYGGQGYDITDYFELRADYGTEEDLHTLVDEAHRFGFKVLLDFVPNHTALLHPYAQDAIEGGEESYYYDFYLREEDNVAYSQHYNQRQDGLMTFLYYFWDDLVNLDHDNPDVQQWMIEAGRRWVEDFGVDGYRIDAVWGTNARTPEFMQRWRHSLKRYKPEVLLLGEDKGTWPESFENRFDVAYDWFPEEGWVSHWSWQTDFSESVSLTIFNDTDPDYRSERLHDAITNEGRGWHPEAEILRFMENNDTFRFIQHHGLERTKMAAALLFALPGVPLIYNGQEIGAGVHPYGAFQIFQYGETIEEQDPYGLYPFYQRLIAIRAKFPALTSDNIERVEVLTSARDYVYAFRRWEGAENVIGVTNMVDRTVYTSLALPTEEMEIDSTETYFLTDLVTGEYIETAGADLGSVRVSAPAYSTRIYAVGHEIVEVVVHTDPSAPELPTTISLEQNYPNPFNPSTTIAFSLPRSGHVRVSVYDVLGRELTTLVEGDLPAGRHEAYFDGTGIASGVYVYRLSFEGESIIRRMMLVK